VELESTVIPRRPRIRLAIGLSALATMSQQLRDPVGQGLGTGEVPALRAAATVVPRRTGGRGGRPRAMRFALVSTSGRAKTAATLARTAMIIVNFMMS